MRPRIGSALALAFALLAGPGCIGLFRPATPAPPSHSGGGVVVNYTTYQGVLQTLAGAVAAKAQGATAYLGAFADGTTIAADFVATFDPEVVAQYRAETGHDPDVWTRLLEQGFFNAFAQVRPEAYLLVWSAYNEAGEEDLEPPDLLLHRRYQVYVVDSEGITGDRIAVGIAHLSMTQANGRYFIVKWEDQVDPTVGATPSNTDDLSFGRRRLNR